MLNKRHKYKVSLAMSLIALTLLTQSLPVTFLIPPAVARSKTDDDTVYLKGTQGRPKLRLKFADDAGCMVEHYDDNEGPQFSFKLFSIEGAKLTEKSPGQIRQMLQGQIGSTVQIEVVNARDQIEKFTFTRYGPNAFPDTEYKEHDLSNTARNFEEEGIFGWPETPHLNIGDYWDHRNVDLFTRAKMRSIIQSLLKQPATDAMKDSELLQNLLLAAENCDTVGDTETALEFLKIFNSKASTSENSTFDLERNRNTLQYLFETGRFKHCDTVLKNIFDFSNANKAGKGSYNTLFARLKYAEWLQSKDKRSAQMLTLAIYDELKKESSRFWRDYYQRDLAALLSNFGQFDKAIECLSWKEPIANLQKYESGTLGMDEIRAYADNAVKIACIKHKKDDTDAGAYLQELSKLYQKHMTDEKEQIASQLPGYHPNLKDIQTLISQTESKASMLTPWQNKNLDVFVEDKFFNIEKCHEAIAKKDKNAYLPLIAKIKEWYETEVPFDYYPHHRINLYCSLLQIARLLSNHSDFDSSNHLLDYLADKIKNKEQQPLNSIFIHIEKAINAERSKQPSDLAWSVLDHDALLSYNSWKWGINKEDKKPSPKAAQLLWALESDRRFAALYNTIGDTDRATICLDHCNELLTQLQNEDASKWMKDIAASMYNLERAITLAKCGRLNRAYIDAQQANAEYPELKYRCEHLQFSFIQAYIIRSLVLAEVFADQNKLPEAIKIASSSHHNSFNLTEKNLADVSSRETSHVVREMRDDALVNAYLAKYYFALGQNLQAQKCILRAVKQRQNNVPKPLTKFASKISVSNGEHAEAAKQILLNFDDDIANLENAKEYAEKAKNFKSDELANLYLRLAVNYQRKNDKEKCNLYFEKALPLLSDEDPGKIKVLQHINISKAEKERLPYLLQAAQLAEKYNPRFQSSYWFGVARVEVDAKEFDQAIIHLKKGISTSQASSDYRFNSLVPTYLLIALAKGGKQQEADALSTEVLKKTAQIYGNDSHVFARQANDIIQYFQLTKRPDLALKLFDTVIRSNTILAWRGTIRIFDRVQYLVQNDKILKEDLPFYHRYYTKLLAAQLKSVPKNHELLAITYYNLASVEHLRRRDKEALRNIELGLEIASLFKGKENALTEVAPLLIPVYESLGKTDEVAMYKKLQSDQKFSRLKDYVDPMHEKNAYDIKPLAGTKVAEQLSKAKADYEDAAKQAPYSPRTYGALVRLFKASCFSLDTETQNYACLKLVDYYEHKTGYDGRETGCVPPEMHRYDPYITLISNHKTSGDIDGAKKWLARAEEKLCDPPVYELWQLAECALMLDDKANALRLAKKSEALCHDEYSAKKLSDLYGKIGDEVSEKRFALLSDEIRHESLVRQKQMREGPFRHVGM